MKKFHINCENITTRPELHDKIALELEFPQWYGNNLDALYDCLTDIAEDTLITLEKLDILEEQLGRYALNFKKVLNNAANDNRFLDVEFM